MRGLPPPLSPGTTGPASTDRDGDGVGVGLADVGATEGVGVVAVLDGAVVRLDGVELAAAATADGDAEFFDDVRAGDGVDVADGVGVGVGCDDVEGLGVLLGFGLGVGSGASITIAHSRAG